MDTVRKILKYLLVVFFVAAGINHFRNPEFYLRIMPPYLPWHEALNYASGFFEILLGLLVLIPRCTRFAGWGLIALLAAVFPANLHMALNPHLFPELPPMAYYIRLPFQLVFIAWVYWATLEQRRNPEDGSN
ncbi:MAG: DoxX family membrane protein [Acidobacteria bacterium]|nr:DoxX family membrane protein [Acidobacteriota bacterium]